jgi:hypothetical protein
MPPERGRAALETRPSVQQHGTPNTVDAPADEPAETRRREGVAGVSIGLELAAYVSATGHDTVDGELQRSRAKAAIAAYLRTFPVLQDALSTPPLDAGDDDPWMTDRESAAHARKLSGNGQVSSEWRKKLRRLELLGMAHRTGDHVNSPRLTRRSTVDAVIRGEIDLEGASDEKR